MGLKANLSVKRESLYNPHELSFYKNRYSRIIDNKKIINKYDK